MKDGSADVLGYIQTPGAFYIPVDAIELDFRPHDMGVPIADDSSVMKEKGSPDVITDKKADEANNTDKLLKFGLGAACVGLVAFSFYKIFSCL